MTSPATVPRRWRPIEELLAACALLTRVPVRASAATTGGAAAFGVVGALVGAAGAMAILLVGDQAPLAGAALAIAAMTLLSGGLHLDGLADTADALMAVGPEAAERARADPRIGAGGAIAVALFVAIDVGWLVGLVSKAGPVVAALACIVAAAISRALVVALVAVAPAGRRGTSGQWFWRSTRAGSVVAAGASAVLIACLAAMAATDPALAWGALGGAAVAGGAGLWLVRTRRGIDGDLLGAVIEIGFASVLGATLLLAR